MEIEIYIKSQIVLFLNHKIHFIMKYCVIWKKSLESLPIQLRASCIPYKTWKKLSKGKTKNEKELLELLHRQCKTTSDTFRRFAKMIFRKHTFLGFFYRRTMRPDVSADELLMYAKLNKTTLYKICKRLDKRSHVKIFQSWLNTNYHNYSFNNGVYLTRLNIMTNNCATTECPICLMEFDDETPRIITQCGHIMCNECLSNLFHLKGRRGILNNLIAVTDIEEHIQCPVCRHEHPCIGMSSANIWPACCANMLRTIDH
jgi:hypothetical protein